MEKRKYIIYRLCAIMGFLLLVFLFFIFVPVSRNINSSIMGIQCRNNDDSGFYEEKQILIEGKYKHYLFHNKPDLFNGKFSIDGYESTHDCEALVNIHAPKEQTSNDLIYINFTSESESVFETYTFGLISSKHFLTDYIIRVFEPVDDADGKTWSNEDGIIIVAPARNREEAIEKARLLEESPYISWN